MTNADLRKRARIVSVHMLPDSKQQLDRACEQRGMTIKMLLGRLIAWFVELDKTEQSVVLGQVEAGDFPALIAHITQRRQSGYSPRPPATNRPLEVGQPPAAIAAATEPSKPSHTDL